MCTIIGSSEKDCVLIILFQIYSTKAGLFEGNLFKIGQYDHFPIFILEEELPIY